MWSWFTYGVLLHLFILPIPIAGYASTLETVVDSILSDAPAYMLGLGDDGDEIREVVSTIRCGPMVVDEIKFPSNITYNIGACIAMNNLKIKVTAYGFHLTVFIEHSKVEVHVIVEMGLFPRLYGTVNIIEWIKPHVEKFSLKIPITWFKTLIEAQMTKSLNKHLHRLLSSADD
ncbi:hypothetical protein ACTXT7_014422 [Hymenolepis weldensis]